MPDLLPAQWSKLIFNSAINTVAAMTTFHTWRCSPARMIRRPRPARARADRRRRRRRRRGRCHAARRPLGDEPARGRARRDRSSDYAHKPSMLEDVRLTARPRSSSSPARSCARPAVSACGSAQHRHVPPGPRARSVVVAAHARGGGVVMRVCVVGCGAVGSLFAAHLARSRTSRSGPTTSSRSTSRRSTPGLRLTAAPTWSRRSRRARRRRDPALRVRHRRDEVDVHGRRDRRDRGDLRRRRRLQRPERGRQRGADRRARAARDPRHDVPGRAGHRPGVVQMDTAGDTWIGPFEERPASMAEVERSPTR